MERLTIHDWMYKRFDPEQVEAIYKKLRAYEDTGLEPEEVKEITSWSYGPFHKKMGDWLKAEQEGRIVVLPRKDSPVWIVEEATHDCDTVPDKDCMSRPDCEGCPALKSYVRRLDEFYYTREEAEKALKGVSEDA